MTELVRRCAPLVLLVFLFAVSASAVLVGAGQLVFDAPSRAIGEAFSHDAATAWSWIYLAGGAAVLVSLLWKRPVLLLFGSSLMALTEAFYAAAILKSGGLPTATGFAQTVVLAVVFALVAFFTGRRS
ncbi:hypothetical protein [uncultured Friedmanniella sp.]|uniref:hypothetical protein n=1 Tax=uncultured Friedmanniella sp. TaxID=335381 RepID=UPI0035C96E77